MTQSQTTIERSTQAPLTQSYQALRKLGIEHLEQLVTDTWVEFGPADPGITILEAVAYAITEIGYRIATPFNQLISPANPAEQDSQSFFTPAQILTTDPITHLDWRKLILDRVPGVRNCWLESVGQTVFVDTTDAQQSYTRAGLTRPAQYAIKGLYNIRVEGEDDDITDQALKLAVEQTFHAHRGLCEDLAQVTTLSRQGIALCADIQLQPSADSAKTFAALLRCIEDYLAPGVPRHSLESLLARNISVDDLFAGPPMTRGFMLDEELLAAMPRQTVYSSDLIKIMMQVPGVIAVDKLELNYANGRLDEGELWELPINPNSKPRLDLQASKFCLFKDLLPIRIDSAALAQAMDDLAREQPGEIETALDLPIPYAGEHSPADYVSVQHEFPQVYGLAGKGLATTASELRKTQAQQLKGYLLLFDQLMADLLAQLNHVRDLFAFDENTLADRTTYYSQAVQGLEDLRELIDVDDTAEYESKLASIHETFDARQGAARSNRVIDHLLARFNEHFDQYVALFHQLEAGAFKEQSAEDILADKVRFLQAYPRLSRRRGSGYDLNGEAWDTTDNLPGVQERSARLLGFDTVSRTNIAASALEGMFVIENLLLRPPPGTDVPFMSTCLDDQGQPTDPYTFRVHVILPAYAGRFGTERENEQIAFRRFAEKTIRGEMPAHILPKICFVDAQDLLNLEKHFRVYLKHRASPDAAEELRNNALIRLLGALDSIHNEYPARKLHPLGEEGDPQPIVLNRSHLGAPDDDP